ncbi:phosphotransferase [Nocardiopsis sp. NPDC007018]|uniref:phosphotransferase n=1 Tax=Nocardiopsis sp. NPDC007018 TaxID=3155721 RepID=UPI0033E58AA8
MGGRTLSGPVTYRGVPAWLRVAGAARRGGRLWDGPLLADAVLDERVPRPALLAEHAWDGDTTGTVFQAHLWERLTGHEISPTPDLSSPARVPDVWWKELRTALDRLRSASAERTRPRSHTPGFLERVPRYLPELAGTDLTVPAWETSHGDLHWANLTTGPLTLLDWEGWGPAPVGYDAAVLHTYALPAPESAARVRAEFADVLECRVGRFSQLLIAAEVIQAAERDDLHARLLPHVRHRVGELLAR